MMTSMHDANMMCQRCPKEKKQSSSSERPNKNLGGPFCPPKNMKCVSPIFFRRKRVLDTVLKMHFENTRNSPGICVKLSFFAPLKRAHLRPKSQLETQMRLFFLENASPWIPPGWFCASVDLRKMGTPQIDPIRVQMGTTNLSPHQKWCSTEVFNFTSQNWPDHSTPGFMNGT